MNYLYGALAMLVIQVVLGLALLYSGAINVAASEPHSAPADWVLETWRERSVRRHAGDIGPPPRDLAARAEEGFPAFRDMCVVCHGAPGVQPSELAKGLLPRAPDLALSAEESTPQELFWMVKHGLKMTGMPAWGATHTDEELWAIVGFLEQLPALSPEAYHALEERAGVHRHVEPPR